LGTIRDISPLLSTRKQQGVKPNDSKGHVNHIIYNDRSESVRSDYEVKEMIISVGDDRFTSMEEMEIGVPRAFGNVQLFSRVFVHAFPRRVPGMCLGPGLMLRFVSANQNCSYNQTTLGSYRSCNSKPTKEYRESHSTNEQ
jgi:hypothetical protein